MSIIDSNLKVIVDTSVYIPYINFSAIHPCFERTNTFYMSAVVLSELYAGAHDPDTIKLLDKLAHTFKKAGRLVAPMAEDWRKTGMIIARLTKKYGFEDIYLSKLQNDILIAISAKKIGALVATNNKKDFLRIQEYVNFSLYS
ncbi:MAG: PIN domain-containing protein [Thermodesulfovibrionales bacterium]|nr:PIN domain-containing protein [Thermodesulfovibrionales bacterium]